VNDVLQPATNDTKLDGVRHDLADEQQALDDIVANITDEQFHLPTPSPGWSVADQIGHLTFFDGTGASAISDPRASLIGLAHFMKAQWRRELTNTHSAHFVHSHQLNSWRYGAAIERRCWRRRSRFTKVTELRGTGLRWGGLVPDGPTDGDVAHGIDVTDALGVKQSSTARLQHIARLGFMTRTWSYAVRGEDVPDGEVLVNLTSPSGEHWTWAMKAWLTQFAARPMSSVLW